MAEKETSKVEKEEPEEDETTKFQRMKEE